MCCTCGSSVLTVQAQLIVVNQARFLECIYRKTATACVPFHCFNDFIKQHLVHKTLVQKAIYPMVVYPMEILLVRFPHFVTSMSVRCKTRHTTGLYERATWKLSNTPSICHIFKNDLKQLLNPIIVQNLPRCVRPFGRYRNSTVTSPSFLSVLGESFPRSLWSIHHWNHS